MSDTFDPSSSRVSAPADSDLHQIRRQEHHVTVTIHLFIAAVIAVIGVLMFMTGALVPFAIVVLCVAAAYAVGVIVVSLVQDRFDLRMPPPRPEELDSVADYQKAKHG